MSKSFSFEDLSERYRKLTRRCHVQCTLIRALAGGVPATEPAIRAYVQHHLKLKGDQAEEAVTRILHEELGERAVDTGTGEIEEKIVHNLNVVRRTKHGPWLGDWMIKACLKAAASRIGLYSVKRGTKGDMAEMGQARAVGISLRDKACPHEIYLTNDTGKAPALTHYETRPGRIQTPKGPASIITDAEHVNVGSRFEFEYRFYDGKITHDDVGDIFASAMIIGLGSQKSFECGKFRIDKLTID